MRISPNYASSEQIWAIDEAKRRYPELEKCLISDSAKYGFVVEIARLLNVDLTKETNWDWKNES